MKKVALLTGGGDAPGLNGILEATSTTLLKNNIEVIGIQDGFEGVFEGRYQKLTSENIKGIHAHSGTLLGTSNRMGTEGREEEFLEKIRALKIDGIVAAGGDGTFHGLRFCEGKVPLIGVPKTIDNDLSGTDITFGFDTACSVVAESVDALRFSANAHRRVIVLETMGRTAGWIALGGGLSSFADAILLPERPYDKKKLLSYLKGKKEKNRGLIVVVAEGAHADKEEPKVARIVEGSPQEERLGGISERIANWIEQELDWEARHVVLGHLQRAKSPTVTDRFLTVGMGVKAASLVMKDEWQKAVVYREGIIQVAPIQDIMGPPKLVDEKHRWLKTAEALGIFV